MDITDKLDKFLKLNLCRCFLHIQWEYLPHLDSSYLRSFQVNFISSSLYSLEFYFTITPYVNSGTLEFQILTFSTVPIHQGA